MGKGRQKSKLNNVYFFFPFPMLFGRGVVIVLGWFLRRRQTEVSENRPVAMTTLRPDRKKHRNGKHLPRKFVKGLFGIMFLGCGENRMGSKLVKQLKPIRSVSKLVKSSSTGAMGVSVGMWLIR